MLVQYSSPREWASSLPIGIGLGALPVLLALLLQVLVLVLVLVGWRAPASGVQCVRCCVL